MRTHGKRSTYKSGCRCDSCREANRLAMARWRAGAKDRIGGAETPHGTRGGYVNWGCRCRACTDAHTIALRDEKHSRHERGLPGDDPRHGTFTAYDDWGCRCRACTDAAPERTRRYRARRSA